MKLKTDFIRKKRNDNDYSEEYMANVLSISQAQYSRLENGKSSCDPEKVRLIADALKVNPLEVVDLNDYQSFFYCNQSGNIENINNNCDLKVMNEIYLAQIEELKKDKMFLQEQFALLKSMIEQTKKQE